jgi:hypothetical protein
MKIKKPDKYFKQICRVAFPEYRGRKWQLEVKESVYVTEHWTEGSRTESIFVDLSTGDNLGKVPHEEHGFLGQHARTVPLKHNIACVQHILFQGHDLGIMLIVHPSNGAQLIEE